MLSRLGDLANPWLDSHELFTCTGIFWFKAIILWVFAFTASSTYFSDFAIEFVFATW
jgi:hypothetical protein